MVNELGPGEAAEQAGRKGWMRLLGMSLGIGAVTGVIIALTTRQGADPFSGPLPLWAAILLSVGLLALWVYAAWYSETRLDEVERNANYYGYAVGGGVLFGVYPIWYFFWWAEVAIEPQHEVLMALLLVTALAGYLWKKFR